MLSKAIKDLKGGLALSHVWIYQAYHEVAAKYKRTAFGPLWIAAQMVFTSISMSIVFGALFGNDLHEVLPYIMGGMLCMQMINFVLAEAPEVYMANSGIISNHAYPFTYYTFESIAKTTILFLHNLIVYAVILVILGRMVVPHWSFLVGLPVVWLNMFTWGTVISMAAARYRDLRYLLPHLTQIVIFASPVMYRADQIGPGKRWIVDWNPFYPFIDMLRSPLMGGAMDMRLWPMALAVTALGLLLWVSFFTLHRKRIAFWV